MIRYFYEISELMFADIFIEIDIGIDNLNSFENSSPINPVLFHKTTEIKKMLYEDEAACDIILELLKARKAMNNAISDLKSLDKSIPKGP